MDHVRFLARGIWVAWEIVAKYNRSNRRIFMRVAPKVLERGSRGLIRDLHNDEPKSVACTADMLLSASMVSGSRVDRG